MIDFDIDISKIIDKNAISIIFSLKSKLKQLQYESEKYKEKLFLFISM